MKLSPDQIRRLLKLVAAVESDPIDCDSCYDQVAEFAEAEIVGAEIPQALHSVQVHRSQCGCCNAEYESLIDGLRGLQSSGVTCN